MNSDPRVNQSMSGEIPNNKLIASLGAAEQAAFIHAKWELGLDGGVLIAVPVPAADALQKSEVDGITLQALNHARFSGVTGKAVTPFLLERIRHLTGERSLTANIALIKNNARVAAELACALHALRGTPATAPG